MRNSTNQEYVLDLLAHASTPMNASIIYEKIAKQVEINLSTIYRILERLCEANLIIKTVRKDKIAYYETARKSHRHHLICTLCHKEIAIDTCPLAILQKNIQQTTGYLITGHALELEGICPKCQKIQNLQKND